MQVVDPGSDEARAVLTAYFRDIVSRGRGRDATDAEVAAAMSAEPSDDLRPPGGLLLLARHDGGVAGCAGLRLLPGGIAELTRMFVLPHARRRGIGQLLVEAVETAAREHQVSTLRLDTSDHLTEARHLYARNGYQEVEPFNDGRFANLWYQKTLT
jgi:GNAT superfamily N-acetyltransferase